MREESYSVRLMTPGPPSCTDSVRSRLLHDDENCHILFLGGESSKSFLFKILVVINVRQYIVRGSMKSRMKTKLWLFNCIFMLRKYHFEYQYSLCSQLLVPYTVFVILNFIL